MEKLTSKSQRVYLDYNATSPLAPSVVEWLAKGDFVFGNPSSVHMSGKKAKRLLFETSEFLLNLFHMNGGGHRLFFHSGASEGLNTFIRGFAFSHFKKNKKAHFFYAVTDHSCVLGSAKDFEVLGHRAHPFSVDEKGEFDREKLIAEMLKYKDGPLLLNYTYVNNESGIVWPLEIACEIKKATGCFVHVDAVQAIGKIDRWWELAEALDSYTFSGHKFGALKGVGWSFFNEAMPYCPLIRGGGQQGGHRAGTENTMGIYSLRLALEELKSEFNYKRLKEAKDFLSLQIKGLVGDEGVIIGEKAACTNGNTIYLLLKSARADIVTTAFDLAGIEVSSGSACSSGASLPSRVLLALGFNHDEAKSGLRFSFSPSLDMKTAEVLFDRIKVVLERFLPLTPAKGPLQRQNNSR